MSSSAHILNLLYLITFFCLFGAGMYSMIGYGLLSVYILLSFLFFPKEATKAYLSKNAIPLYLYLIFLCLTGNFNFTYPASQFIILSPLVILNFQLLLFGKSTVNKKALYFYVGILYIIILYFIIQYLQFIWNDVMAARYLISVEKDKTVSIGGGFGMPYGLCLLIPFLFRALKEYKMTYYMKMLIIGFILIGSFLIIRSSFTTAIILLLAGIGYSFVYKYRWQTQLLFFICFAILILPLFEIIPFIISVINPDSYVLENRIEEMRMILSDSDNVTEGDFGSRLGLAAKSLTTFLSSPLYGVGPIVGYDFYALWKAGVGSHCEWIDIFARYGLFAVLIIWYFIANRSVKAPVHRVSLTMFVVLGFLNPVLETQIILFVFHVIPLTNYVLKK